MTTLKQNWKEISKCKTIEDTSFFNDGCDNLFKHQPLSDIMVMKNSELMFSNGRYHHISDYGDLEIYF